MTDVLKVRGDTITVRASAPTKLILKQSSNIVRLRPETPRLQVNAPRIRTLGVIGPPGPVGPQGPAGTNDAYYRHVQNAPSSIWLINHNLGKRPSVSVRDSSGEQIMGEISWVDDDTVVVAFSAAFGGEAYLN
jgi:hypothetical protein